MAASVTAALATVAVLAALPAAPARAMADDQIRSQEWWLDGIHVTQAWQFGRGSGITVAVLSTGVDTAHPDLTGSVVTGPDYTGSGRTAGGPFWGIEGTSAASVIAGHGDSAGDASGIAGIAPDVKILSVRVALDPADPLNASAAVVGHLPDAIAEGIRYAVDHGAQVIDLPLDPASLASDGAASAGLHTAAGGGPAERAAVSYAISKGAVLVAPAGDDGASGSPVDYPAAYPGVIALSAVDQQFARPQFASRQSYVALTAPGVNVTAAGPPAGYRTMTTTDAASAMAAGVAALIRSRYPDLTASQVRQALLAGAVSPPGQPGAGAPGYGAGSLDALKAVQAATGITAAPATAPATGTGTPDRAQAPGAAGGTAGRAATTTGILGTARTVLRDAAIVAGLLIVVLVASLAGLRVRRRRPALAARAARAARAAQAAPPPRMLLSAPVAPAAGSAPMAPVAPVAAAVLASGASSGAGGARHAKPPGERVVARVVPPAGGMGGRPARAGRGGGPRPPWDPAPIPPSDAAPVPASDLPPVLAGPAPHPPLRRRGLPGERRRPGLADPADGRRDDAGSGPDSGALYIWDPAALTDPFPAVPPRSPGAPDVPGREGPGRATP
jgi:subtilisin family serine protease